MTETTYWHKFFQGMLEDIGNLRELSGKIISAKARKHQQMIRADFICHTEGNLSDEKLKSIVRPFSHFKKRNVIEFKSFHESLNKNIFRYYIGRALCAENCDDVKNNGETTLTVITLHKPVSILPIKKYKFEQITPWKYRSHYDDELNIYVLVQREMRGLKEGEALALLQIIGSERDKQILSWKSIFEQDLENKEVLKKIAEQISKESFMSLVEEMKLEGKIEEFLENINWIAPEFVSKYESQVRSVKTEQELAKLKKIIKAEIESKKK